MASIAIGRADAPARAQPTERVEIGGPELTMRRKLAGFGLWIYLLSDAILFAALFAAYGVLSGETAGGPGAADLFHLDTVAIETACLLTSSFTCGLAMLAVDGGRRAGATLWFGITFALGATFLGIELNEFAGLVTRNAGPDRSAFLSAFFTLVGTHGLHVFIGLIWLAALGAQMWVKGLSAPVARRLLLFSIFWHVLDIVWIAVFTIVYLMGAR